VIATPPASVPCTSVATVAPSAATITLPSDSTSAPVMRARVMIGKW
jgi:hypothetical protein